MKKLKLFLISILAVSAIIVSMSSCSPNKDVELDQTLLYGKWQETNSLNFEVYNADGTGYTWDEADDVTEAEAQQFTWTLEEDVLTHIHIMEMDGSIPKVYTVTKLTATELTYEDDFGKAHTFNKQ
ncbi:MAG: lipocalin family protein [Paludibacteraceae bacterium]|nr:lipocalin family protein [Paludibacteraceae bacterium]